MKTKLIQLLELMKEHKQEGEEGIPKGFIEASTPQQRELIYKVKEELTDIYNTYCNS